MIRVTAPSRLHFGLLSLPAAKAHPWRNEEGQETLPRRHFGGVGLMVQRPGIELTARRTNTWSADGPLSQRALQFAQTYCSSLRIQESFRLQIITAAPEHAGLGTGTQLALAVARAIAELTQQSARDATTLALHVGRGRRSAIGVHGFQHGGLLVEGGKTSEGISPLLARHAFPDGWRIWLLTPRDLIGTHGSHELAAFADLAGQHADDRVTETLCRLVLLGMLPALIERDLDTFGEALYDFNRRVGTLFQRAQGGVYAHPRIEQLVRMIRDTGVKGVGQSSWGPTVFAVVDEGQAAEVGEWLTRRGHIAADEMLLTEACNHGASIAGQ